MTKRKETILTPGEKIAQQILDNYDLKNTQDVQDALKQVFGPIFEAILKGEMQ
ncbi:IS256 family transposase, partial [Veillonella magna]|nr:IS256 family transposase [Veillonella magna]MBM6913717.1 IS256 family transposase [Veillonella magna]